jgi:oligosaccharide reducing-end xylanase
MKKVILYTLLAMTISFFGCTSNNGSDDCKNDAKDARGKMQAWEKGAWETGKYRNVFLDAGYSQERITAKLKNAYHEVFEGPNRVYFEVGDSMAYVSDVKNHDCRTEGLSYGLMVAVQLDKKDVFDRLWRWTRTYMQHQGGSRDGYFAWSVDPETGEKFSNGSASDGELYFITALLFASNRWGNDTGINYYGEARRILDAMWSKDGTDNVTNVINVEHKLITFVPDSSGYNWTDPSYHVAAFYEVWAEYANDGHEQFYRDCADSARSFLHRAIHPETGLNPDYTQFNGEPFNRWGQMGGAFRYDSWRVPMNIAMDYSWYAKDKKWQKEYAKNIQNFLYCEGIDSFVDQYNIDGSEPEWILPAGKNPSVQRLRHSLGLKSTAAAASIMGTQAKSWKFIDELWNAQLKPYDDGYFDPYYDGLLYLFSIMHLSGNYQIITPNAN